MLSTTIASADTMFVPPLSMDPTSLLRVMLFPQTDKFKILYRRDDIFVHPLNEQHIAQYPSTKYNSTTVANFHIPGCLFIVEDLNSEAKQQKRNIYLAWAPYSLLGEINDRLLIHEKSNGDLVTKADMFPDKVPNDNPNRCVDLSASGYVSAHIVQQKDTQVPPASTKIKKKSGFSNNMYAMAIPLQDILSIKRHIPTMGWSFMVVMMKNGVSQAPLFFHDGGIQDFFGKLQQFASVKKSKEDANVFFVECCEPLQKSLSQLHFDEYFEDMYKSSSDLSWQLLEWGTKVKKKAQTLSDAVFGKKAQPLSQEEKEQKAANIIAPSPVQFASISSKIDFDHLASSADSVTTTITSSTTSSNCVNDAKPLAASKNTSVKSETDEDSFEFIDERERKEIIEQSVKSNKSDPWSAPHLTAQEWKLYFDTNGTIKDVATIRRRIFYGGVADDIRGEVWKFLLGYYDFNSTYEERNKLDQEKTKEYYAYKQQWTSITEKQASRYAAYRDRKHRIEKDVVRTDRNHPLFNKDDSPYLVKLNDVLLTYAFYNFDLGYCQGMGDLLSPILSVIPDEVGAFWAFASLMEKMEGNFQLNSTTMETQLLALNNLVKLMDFELFSYLDDNEATNFFFCFRWILVLFKREFAFDDIKRMWESLWSDHYGGHYHLFIAYSVLHEHKKHIISSQLSFDEILKFCVDLSGKMNMLHVLKQAEMAYVSYQQKMDKAIKK